MSSEASSVMSITYHSSLESIAHENVGLILFEFYPPISCGEQTNTDQNRINNCRMYSLFFLIDFQSSTPGSQWHIPRLGPQRDKLGDTRYREGEVIARWNDSVYKGRSVTAAWWQWVGVEKVGGREKQWRVRRMELCGQRELEETADLDFTNILSRFYTCAVYKLSHIKVCWI